MITIIPNRFLAICEEKVGNSGNPLNFIDIVDESFTAENALIDTPTSVARSVRRDPSFGTFDVVGGFNAVLDYKTLGFILRGLTGGSSAHLMTSGAYEHVFYEADIYLPTYSFLIGTDFTMRMYSGMYFESGSIEIPAADYLRISGTLRGMDFRESNDPQAIDNIVVTYNDTPLLKYHQAEFWLGTESAVPSSAYDLKALRFDWTNNIADEPHLGSRFRGKRWFPMYDSTLMITDDNTGTPWSEDTAGTLAIVNTQLLSGSNCVEVDPITGTTDTGKKIEYDFTTVFGADGIDITRYTRMGFWMRLERASGSWQVDDTLTVSLVDGAGTPQSNDELTIEIDVVEAANSGDWVFFVADLSDGYGTADYSNIETLRFTFTMATGTAVFSLHLDGISFWNHRMIKPQKKTLSCSLDTTHHEDELRSYIYEGTPTDTTPSLDYVTANSLRLRVQSEQIIASPDPYKMEIYMPSVKIKSGEPQASSRDQGAFALEIVPTIALGTTLTGITEDDNLSGHTSAEDYYNLLLLLWNNVSAY